MSLSWPRSALVAVLEERVDWRRAQDWERQWWDGCVNTFGEEYKQLLYADRMGLVMHHDGRSPYNIDLCDKRVLDIGGGPTSLLLKCVDFQKALVIDPLPMVPWVLSRYECANISVLDIAGENLDEVGWDECWLYNVLQHVKDPAKVLRNARKAADLIRIFEWIDTPMNVGHPHTLTGEFLDKHLYGEGRVEKINGQNNCTGVAYYGVFPTGEIV